MSGDRWHQSFGKEYPVDRFRREIGGSPGAHLEIECIDMAWRSLHVYENAISSPADQMSSSGNSAAGKSFWSQRRHQKRTRDSGSGNFKEVAPAKRRASEET
jgi:hypothetical protein